MPSALTNPIITERGTKRISRRQPGHAENDLDDARDHDGRQDVANAVQLDHRTDHQRNRTGRRRDHRGPAAERGHHEANTTDANQRDLGSTPEMKENEITSGISASAVTKPASVSRIRTFGERKHRGDGPGVVEVLRGAGTVVIDMKLFQTSRLKA